MSPLLRIIDANANRAREGLRVLEDAARFALQHAALAADCKRLRHDLAQTISQLDAALVPSLGSLSLLRARDTSTDVLTSTTTTTEHTRDTLASLALTESSRVGEALRVLEETCKLIPEGAVASAACKQLRYRAYDTSKAIALALAQLAAPWQPRLCVLLTQSLCTHHAWQHIALEAIKGGADCLQLREKTLEAADLFARAKELVALAAPFPHVRIFINDRIDIALASRAQGVHLGQTDLPAATARELASRAGSSLLIGISTSTLSEALAAHAAGANLCGVGPMFTTTTKHKPTLAGPAALANYLQHELTRTLPHLAIGGITPSNVQELRAVGCKGIAVSSAVCGAPDPASICRAFVQNLA